MPVLWKPLTRLLAWTLAYYLAALVAVWFAPQGPDAVSLIWPAAGIGFSALMVHGNRYWPIIALPLVPLHLWNLPTPWTFVPFSMAANVLPTVLAVWMIRRTKAGPLDFRLITGFNMLGASLVLVLTSALIGATGMWFSGMIPLAQFGARAAAWAMADLVGMVAVAPALMTLLRIKEFPALGGRHRGRTTPVRISVVGRCPDRQPLGVLVLGQHAKPLRAGGGVPATVPGCVGRPSVSPGAGFDGECHFFDRAGHHRGTRSRRLSGTQEPGRNGSADLFPHHCGGGAANPHGSELSIARGLAPASQAVAPRPDDPTAEPAGLRAWAQGQTPRARRTCGVAVCRSRPVQGHQ
ncbi:MAG: MASE1 domain-containing protein [Ahniella sp.]|nr:MASE1 domain-containing protein [Ahniella sp.]